MLLDKPRISRSVFWNHLGKVAEYALLYATSVVVARSLGVDANGRYAGIVSIIQMLLVFGSFGIETALNTYLPRQSGLNAAARIRYIVRRAVGFRLVLLLGLVIPIAYLLSLFVGVANTLLEYLWLMLLLAVTRSVASLLAMVLTAGFRTDVTAKVNGLARLAELAAVLVLSKIGTSVPAILAVMFGGAILQIGGYLLSPRTEWRGPVEPIPLRPIVVFGGIFWLNTAVDYFLGRQGDVLFLSILRTDTAQASIYDVAYSLMQAGTFVMAVGLSGVSLAALAKIAVESPQSLPRFYEFLVRITSVLIIPVLTFLVFQAAEVVPLVYSARYVAVVPVLQILLVLRITSRLFAWGENADYLLAVGLVGSVVLLGLAAAATTVVLHLVLIPRYGAVGAAWASGIGGLSANILGFWRVRSLSPVQLQFRSWMSLVACSCAAGIGVTLLPLPGTGVLPLLIRGLMFVLVLLLGLSVVRPLKPEDLQEIRRALQRAT
jgi:O-antigen/teichoic acid export membrane protein